MIETCNFKIEIAFLFPLAVSLGFYSSTSVSFPVVSVCFDFICEITRLWSSSLDSGAFSSPSPVARTKKP